VIDHLKVAEVMDAYRLIPRLIICAVYAFMLWYTWNVTEMFFKALFDVSVTEWKLAGITAFGGLTIPALGALAAGITKAYMTSGRKWNGEERRKNGNV
jgi:hypothetical protein